MVAVAGKVTGVTAINVKVIDIRLASESVHFYYTYTLLI